MTTLITGAGLVGTSYGQVALKRGEKLVFIDPLPREDYLRERLGPDGYVALREDVRHLPGLLQAIKDHKVETVLHTTGLIGRRVELPLHNGMDININGVLTVAEAVRLSGVRRLIHISTFGVYDWRRPAPVPMDEDYPLGSGQPYSNTKAAQELLLEAYQRTYGFELIVLRPANVFGVGHFWGGSGGGEKVQALVESGLRGIPARIPQEQTMAFEYVYSKDIGRALDLAATVPMPERNVFNIGIGAVTTFDQLVGHVRRVVNDLRVEIIPGTPPVSRTQHMSIERAARYLGWRPSYTLEAAFEDYAKDLRARMR
jgi:UDP-glucose 4-epimerase